MLLILPQLIAWTDPTASEDDTPCVADPAGGYRGLENQLYRVEIHTPGDSADGGNPTFKWSRENGSVVFGVVRADAGDKGTTRVRVQQLGLDRRLDLETGDWVELVDDRQVLAARLDATHPGPPPLLQVQDVDRAQMVVTLAGAPATPLDPTMHPLLRRWDHRVTVAAGEADPGEGALVVQAEPTGKSIKLEHGLEVRFTGDQAYYQTGDYWLVSARTTGEVALAPGLTPSPTPGYVTARGEVHHYAPLAKLVVDAAGKLTPTTLRRIVKPVWDVIPP
jgi:hypothetical protein